MKSEHRHELQTNDLSKLTKKAIEKVEKHGLKIAVVLCLAAVLVMGYRLYSNSSSRAQREAWYEFSTAETADSADGFVEIAEKSDFQGTTAADWALLMGAELRSAKAIPDMLTDRENAVSSLNTASEEFEKLINNKHYMIKQRAIFGLARTQESLGNLDAAVQQYQKLAGDEFKSSVYHEDAKERLEALKKSGPQAFYAWFMKQNPKPPAPPKPNDGSQIPSTGFDLPEGFPFGSGAPSAPLGDAPPAGGSTPAEDAESLKSLPTLDPPGGDAVTNPDTTPDTPAEPNQPAPEADTEGAAEKPGAEK